MKEIDIVFDNINELYNPEFINKLFSKYGDSSYFIKWNRSNYKLAGDYDSYEEIKRLDIHKSKNSIITIIDNQYCPNYYFQNIIVTGIAKLNF